MKKRILFQSMIVASIFLFLAACGSIPIAANSSSNLITRPDIPVLQQPTPEVSQQNLSGNASLLAAYQGTLEDLYAMVSPSVVNIQVTTKTDTVPDNFSQVFPFFNLPQGQNNQESPQQYSTALGSGFVWDKSGHIVTNNHVVSDAYKIEVIFSDGTRLPAELVGADPDSDLAVIKVDLSSDKLFPVQLADSQSLKVGQLAVAIGDPFGLEGTMTVGIVSALGRSLPVNEGVGPSYTIPDIIQTDAPINPGNSGGVLINSEGKVVGVTAAIESPTQANAGIGFAIPSAIVTNVVPSLIDTGSYQHPWLGISGGSLIPDLATAMNLDSSQRGILIQTVLPNSPAEKAGLIGSSKQITIDGQNVLVGGDVITAIDGQVVQGIDDLIVYLFRYTKVEQTINLTVLRDGKEKSIEVTLMARPSSQDTSGNSQLSSGVHLGITGVDVNQGIASAMNLPESQTGILVQQVEVGSLADKVGLHGSYKPTTIQGQSIMVGGDIITGVNGEAVNTIQELQGILSTLDANQALTLTILRNGEKIKVTINAAS